MGSEIQIAVNWEIKDNKFQEYYDLTGQFVFGKKKKKGLLYTICQDISYQMK